MKIDEIHEVKAYEVCGQLFFNKTDAKEHLIKKQKENENISLYGEFFVCAENLFGHILRLNLAGRDIYEVVNEANFYKDDGYDIVYLKHITTKSAFPVFGCTVKTKYPKGYEVKNIKDFFPEAIL